MVGKVHEALHGGAKAEAVKPAAVAAGGKKK